MFCAPLSSNEVHAPKASDDAIAFGVADFLFHRQLCQGVAALELHAPISLPTIRDFSIKNPAHVASLALRGYQILPKDRDEIFSSVADAGRFTEWVRAQLSDLKNAREACQRETSVESFFRLSAIHEEETPLLNFLRSGRNARANFLAKEYGHKNVGELQTFIGEVTAFAADHGFVSHHMILTPDRFLDHLERDIQRCGRDEAAGNTSDALSRHRAVLRRRTALEILLFARSAKGELGTTKLTIDGSSLVVEGRDEGRPFRHELTDFYMTGETIRAEGYRLHVELTVDRNAR